MSHVGRAGGGCLWMDSTEVTRAQYQEFLETTPADASNIPACKGQNVAFGPLQDIDMSLEANPIAGIDWCDAAAFCAWAGKTLCGTYDAVSVHWSDFVLTCTDGDNGEFDYDAMTKTGHCNGGGASSTVPVKTSPGCVTPTLVYDLVGNVREWTDECDGTSCFVRGGSFQSSGAAWGCKARISTARTAASVDLGFRCCAEEP